jgi:rRNA-processing protein FCF1
MKVVMDSDCLIKLTKAGVKERVCGAWEVYIPALVSRETTVAAPRLPDAARIKDNIKAGLIVVKGGGQGRKGEDAALDLFRTGAFQAVATDDVRFVRRLRGLGVPFAVPAVIVTKLHREGVLTRPEADAALAALVPFISAEEHAAAELMLTGGSEA